MTNKQKIKKIKPGKIERREAKIGYIFITPWLIGVVMFLIIPMIQSFQFSLADIKITPVGLLAKFVGRANYTDIFRRDPQFPFMLGAYFIQTLISVPVIVVFALLIAMLLNGKIRMKGFFRLIYFLPVIIASGPVMNLLAGQGATEIPALNSFGIYNVLLKFLYPWIADAIFGLFQNMIMILWYSGVQILIFLSALQKIDSSLYEAAKIDGTNTLQKIHYIILPSLKSTVVILFLFALGGIMKGNFGLFYNLVGPTNSNLFPYTDIIETFVYRALINQFNFSYSAAVGLYQSIFGFIIVLFSNWLVRRFDSESALF
jgi:ABC-type sugar transport system permease subunit